MSGAPTATPRRGSRTWWSGVLPLPTVRAAAVLVALVPLVWVAPVTVPFWAPVLAVAALVTADAWLAPTPWHLVVDRELPPIVSLGSDAEVVWSVRNPTGRRAAVAVADALPPSLGAARRRFALTVPAGSRRQVTATLAPSRRGTFRPATLTVRVTGPLGLGRRQADRAVPGRVEVHPSFRSRAAAELRVRRNRVLEEGLRAIRARGGGTQFDALREYVEGDDVRRVDWAATARAGHPVVRTYRAERNQQVLALLDAGRLSAGLVEGVPRLDHAMDAVLALATIAMRSGDRTGLVVFGTAVHATVPARNDQGQLRRLSTAMHAVEPELAESDYREAFRTALGRFRRQATLVLFTELGAEAVQESLVPALPLLVRDHAVIVASVRDPAVEHARDRVPDRPADVYRSAAAVTVLRERDRAAQQLRALGVQVVDALPGELAGRVGDAYLETKARGR
ncbi:DUF58 domain-containing protein [Egicoccus sp. AB-alg2]|uniref:DUF58 domain-containing protein n=1 Tax=Egicoccus sp. AB-alg2 TaxID=3242693 RepID=UPI00359DCFDA